MKAKTYVTVVMHQMDGPHLVLITTQLHLSLMVSIKILPVPIAIQPLKDQRSLMFYIKPEKPNAKTVIDYRNTGFAYFMAFYGERTSWQGF
jgi:hypothetical protein